MASAQSDSAVEDAWVTTERQIEKGDDLTPDEGAELLGALDPDWCDIPTWDQLKAWRREDEDQECVAFQDLALYTHKNSVTGDQMYYWNYGLGDNDYGSFHFQPAGAARSNTTTVMRNGDGDLDFLGEDFKKFVDPAAWPTNDGAQSSRCVLGLIKFYQRVEEEDDFDSEEYEGVFTKKSTPVDSSRFPREE